MAYIKYKIPNSTLNSTHSQVTSKDKHFQISVILKIFRLSGEAEWPWPSCLLGLHLSLGRCCWVVSQDLQMTQKKKERNFPAESVGAASNTAPSSLNFILPPNCSTAPPPHACPQLLSTRDLCPLLRSLNKFSAMFLTVGWKLHVLITLGFSLSKIV